MLAWLMAGGLLLNTALVVFIGWYVTREGRAEARRKRLRTLRDNLEWYRENLPSLLRSYALDIESDVWSEGRYRDVAEPLARWAKLRRKKRLIMNRWSWGSLPEKTQDALLQSRAQERHALMGLSPAMTEAGGRAKAQRHLDPEERAELGLPAVREKEVQS